VNGPHLAIDTRSNLNIVQMAIAGLALSLVVSGCSQSQQEGPLMWTGVTQQQGLLVLLTSHCKYKPVVLVELLDEDTKQVLWQVRIEERFVGLPETQKPNVNRFVVGQAPRHFEETVAFRDSGDNKLRFRALWRNPPPRHSNDGVGSLASEIQFKSSDVRASHVAVEDGREEFSYVTEKKFEQYAEKSCTSLEPAT